MKKVIFMLALALGLMSFSPVNENENYKISNNLNLTEVLETNSFCDYYTRRCFYQGGELLGCTAWECVIVLDEIVISSGPN